MSETREEQRVWRRPRIPTTRLGTPSAGRSRTTRWEPVPQVTVRFGMGRSILYNGVAGRSRRSRVPCGSPPGPSVPTSVCLPNGNAAGAGPAPSDMECGPDPGQGSVRMPHAPAPSNACAIATRCHACPNGPPPSACPAPHVPGEAGSLPPHRGQTGTGPGTPGLGTQNVAHMQISPATIKRMKHARHQAQTLPPPQPCGASTHGITPIASAWRLPGESL